MYCSSGEKSASTDLPFTLSVVLGILVGMFFGRFSTLGLSL